MGGGGGGDEVSVADNDHHIHPMAPQPARIPNATRVKIVYYYSGVEDYY